MTRGKPFPWMALPPEMRQGIEKGIAEFVAAKGRQPKGDELQKFFEKRDATEAFTANNGRAPRRGELSKWLAELKLEQDAAGEPH